MQRVVLITQDKRCLGTVRAVLGNPDCEVVVTAEVAAGLERLREANVRCVIVDCGVEGLTREMRHLLQYSAGVAGVPVLWITPYGARDPMVRELGLSRMNLLPRPFTPLELLERVQESIWIGPYVPGAGGPAQATL